MKSLGFSKAFSVKGETMICEIISVGTELLLGDVTDTNATYLSRKMREMGFLVYHRTTVGDNRKRMYEELERAYLRSDMVIVTGGLGPTYDDITREVAADLFQMPLCENKEVREKIAAFFSRRGFPMSENNLRQALVPEGAKVLSNDWGTAPGLWLEKNEKIMILLPGVPSEMKAIFENRVKGELEKRSFQKFSNLILHFYGISESLVDEKLSDLMQNGKNPTVSPYAGKGEVEIHITAFSETEMAAAHMCDVAKDEILSRIGEYYYGEGNTSLEKELVRIYSENGYTIATAESCTGGLLSQRITSVSGASCVIELGVCSYSEKIKNQILSVSEAVLEENGVYSKECALDMARGVRSLAGSTVG
ncbi:MAG: competence/damage-inducible protein A, partial [Clostridia bacterium]|nr:competence/damage-inducible protein A [Clostridia bacterium]